MAIVNLGRVVGKDGGFGNITCEYVDDGGEPDIDITKSGEDTAKDFHFIFKNIVTEPLDSASIENIVNGQVVNTSKVVTGTGLTTFFSRIKEKFAAKIHKHSADDITSGTLSAARIADNSIALAKLDSGVRDSLSQGAKVTTFPLFSGNAPSGAADSGRIIDFSYFPNGDKYYFAVDYKCNVWIGFKSVNSSTGQINWTKL